MRKRKLIGVNKNVSYIDLKCVQAVEIGLLEQLSILEKIWNELQSVETEIRSNPYIEETARVIRRNGEEIEDELRNLRELAVCLQNVRELYQKTEQKITEVYDLDVTIFPKVEFGVYRIAVEKKWESKIYFISH